MTSRTSRQRQAKTAGALAGAAIAAILLLVLVIVLGGEPGSALKAAAAVWLAALPILGLGALGGWIVAVGASSRRRAVRQRR